MRGNHDWYLDDVQPLLAALTAAGVEPLGGRTREVCIRGQRVLLAGTERPWFRPLPDSRSLDTAAEPPPALRILLSHSPDQLPWAQAHDFDLMLAGHTHGGQIRLPGIGPLIANSWYGVKYASGVFFRHPTLLHVSRGVAGREPLRWHCRPELTRLILRSPRQQPTV